MAVSKTYKIVIKYTVLTACRDWLLWAVLGLLLATIVFSMFLGSTSLVEEAQTAITCAAAAGRFIAVSGMILFVCFQVQRAMESKEIELMLSRPLSRAQFVLAYCSGFFILAAAITTITTGFLIVVHLLQHQPLSLGWIAAWGFSLSIEAFIVTAFALFIGLLTRSAVFTSMVVFAFYLLSRLIGFFLVMAKGPMVVSKMPLLMHVAGIVIQGVSIILPRFDILTQSEWLVYGIPDVSGLVWCMVAALVYIPFILAMAIFDLSRKQF